MAEPDSLPDILQAVGIRKPFVISEEDLVHGKSFARFKAMVPNSMVVTVFFDTPQTPTDEAVSRALALYEATRSDGIVTFGRQPAVDLAKALTPKVKTKGSNEYPGRMIRVSIEDYTVRLNKGEGEPS